MNIYNDETPTNLLELSLQLRQKPDVFTPDLIKNLFGCSNNTTKNTVFSLDRFKKIYSHNVGLISFAPLSCKGVFEYFENKQSNGNDLFDLNINRLRFEGDSFFLDEKPRLGFNLISIGAIPNSRDKSFLDQTKILARYIEVLIPEIKKTKFWIDAVSELGRAEISVSCNRLKLNYNDKTTLLCNLAINRYFRPLIIELLQQSILYDREIGKKIFQDETSWSNSIETIQGITQDFKPVNFEDRSFYGLHIGGIAPDAHWPHGGCSFICNLDWLSEIL